VVWVWVVMAQMVAAEWTKLHLSRFWN
jgi:hypothetical protein